MLLLLSKFWPILDTRGTLTNFHGDETIFFSFEKKNPKWQTLKNLFFQNCQFSIFFVKVSWIGPCIRWIDWCKGHWCGSTYMVERLSERKLKNRQKIKEYIERRHGEPFEFLFLPKMGLLGSQAVLEKKVQFWIMSNFLAPFFQLFMGKNLFF